VRRTTRTQRFRRQTIRLRNKTVRVSIIALRSYYGLGCAPKETLMKPRIFMILSCVLFSVTAALGQSTPEKAPDALTQVRQGFNEVNGWVMTAAETVPADKYNYRPADSVRTFGQLVAHITDSYNYFCARGVGTKVEWATPIDYS
jgi:hypothetical protein